MARTQKKVKAKQSKRTTNKKTTRKKVKLNKKTNKKGVSVRSRNGSRYYTGESSYRRSRTPRGRTPPRIRRRSRTPRSRTPPRRSRTPPRRSRTPPRRRNPGLSYLDVVSDVNEMIKDTYGEFIPRDFNYFFEKSKFDKLFPRQQDADYLFNDMLRPALDTILQFRSTYGTLLEETAQIINMQAGARESDVNLFDGENLTIGFLQRGEEVWTDVIKENSYNVIFSHTNTHTASILAGVCTLRVFPGPESCRASQTEKYIGIKTISHESPPRYSAVKVIEIGGRGEADDIFLVLLAHRLRELQLESKEAKKIKSINVYTHDKFKWTLPAHLQVGPIAPFATRTGF